MGRSSGAMVGVLLFLAVLLASPRKSFQPGGYSYFSRTGIYPHTRVIQERELTEEMEAIEWPDYPQVTAKTRLDPRTPDYQVKLAQKYPEELAQTREAYSETRRVLGLRDYDAPPMPRTSRRR